jgi:hypothetical protein
MTQTFYHSIALLRKHQPVSIVLFLRDSSDIACLEICIWSLEFI